jgi:hypothetical protein
LERNVIISIEFRTLIIVTDSAAQPDHESTASGGPEQGNALGEAAVESMLATTISVLKGRGR